MPEKISRSAVQALLADPTTARAASVIGLQKELRGDAEGARQAFDYAIRLSGRELQTHIWAINDASKAGNIDRVLLHYDMALRTSRDAPDLLFPVLANALRDPVVRDRLARLSGSAPWRRSFVVYAAQMAPQIRATMTFFAEAPAKGMIIEADARDALVTTAFNRGMVALAWRFFRSVHSGPSPDRSFDPEFVSAESVSTPFDWQIPEAASADARFELADEGMSFAFDIPSSFRGPILQQVTGLKPGTYRIDVEYANSADHTTDGLEWAMACHESKMPIARVAASSPTITFRIPANCPFQILTLETASKGTLGPVIGVVERVEVVSMRGGSPKP